MSIRAKLEQLHKKRQRVQVEEEFDVLNVEDNDTLKLHNKKLVKMKLMMMKIKTMD
jgi:hypothetical protein